MKFYSKLLTSQHKRDTLKHRLSTQCGSLSIYCGLPILFAYFFWSYILSLCLFYARCIDGGIGTGAKCFVCHACSFTTHISDSWKTVWAASETVCRVPISPLFSVQKRSALFSSNLIIFCFWWDIPFLSHHFNFFCLSFSVLHSNKKTASLLFFKSFILMNSIGFRNQCGWK